MPSFSCLFWHKADLTVIYVSSELSHYLATPTFLTASTEQQSTAKIDLMLGGGRAYYERRADGRNLSAEMVEQGYHYVQSYSQLEVGNILPLSVLYYAVPSYSAPSFFSG